MITKSTHPDADLHAQLYESRARDLTRGGGRGFGFVQLAAYWWAQADPADSRPGLLAVEVEARRRSGAVRPKGGRS